MSDSIIMSLDINVVTTDAHAEHLNLAQPSTPVGFHFGVGKENSPNLGSTGSLILDILREFPENHQKTMIADVEKIWNELDLPDSEVEKRLLMFRDAFGSALNSILTAGLEKQVAYKLLLNERIAQYEKTIRETEAALELPAAEVLVTVADEGLYQREIRLRTRGNELIALKMERQTTLEALSTENRQLSRALGVQEVIVPSAELQLRTQFLEDLRAANSELGELFEVRSAQMAELRTQITDLSEALRVPGATVDWENISVQNLETAAEKLKELEEQKAANIESAGVLFKRIKYLCGRLGVASDLIQDSQEIEQSFHDPDIIQQLELEKDRLEAEAKQNLRSMVLKQRDSILSMYDQVYASTDEKSAFMDLISDDFTEELLNTHEAELERLREYHDDHRQIFDGLDAYTDLMGQKCKFEERETDPEVMKNRGGVLLKLQGEKKKVVHQLTKVISDLHAAVALIDTNTNTPFRICGMSLHDYLASRQQVYDATKADNIKGRKNDPPSAMKRKAGADTPTGKRLKNEAQPCSKKGDETYVVSKKTTKVAEETATAKNMGPIARRIHFTDKTASQSRCPTSAQSSAGTRRPATPRTAMGKR